MEGNRATYLSRALVSAGLVRRLLLWCAVLLPAATAGAALFVDGWPAQRYLAIYTAPLFLAAPLWLRIRLGQTAQHGRQRVIIDALVFLLAFARFVIGPLLPFSGHMLFLTYSGLTTRNARYRLLAIVLLGMTTWFKLSLWQDLRTWITGLMLGVIAAVFVFVAERNSQPVAAARDIAG